MTKRRCRKPRYRVPRRKLKAKPYLLTECPIEYAKGIYQGEATMFSKKEHSYLTPYVRIAMRDAEALKPLKPCFGTKNVA